MSIDMGQLSPRSKVTIDPSLVSSSNFQGATDYPFQRKVIFDPKGGDYFVFYSNGSVVGYSYSSNANSWSTMQPMPAGWPKFIDSPTSFPSIASYGQKVVAA